MSQATPDEKYHLIARRLQEVLGGDAIKALLVQGKTPKCYWGMYRGVTCLETRLNTLQEPRQPVDVSYRMRQCRL